MAFWSAAASDSTTFRKLQARLGNPPPFLPSNRWDRKYWTTYKVLDILQKVFYRSNPAREAFVELCEDSYVQKMTFDSYLYKTVVPGNPVDDFKLLVSACGSTVFPMISSAMQDVCGGQRPSLPRSMCCLLAGYSLQPTASCVHCRLGYRCKALHLLVAHAAP